MSAHKGLIMGLTMIFFLGLIGNIFVVPFVTEDSSTDEMLTSVVYFIEDGWSLQINIPVFGNIDTTINPISWFWLGSDKISGFVVDQLTVLSYIPPVILYPLLILTLLSFTFSIISLIRGVS